MKASAALVSSNKRHISSIRRWISRLVWSRWLGDFLFWEGTGDLKYTPWVTLSETAWDFEKEYPGTQAELEAFLVGLAIHIHYGYTLQSSVDFAYAHLDEFAEFVDNTK